MDLHLAGKTVIVTGGDSNIGRGITLGFAEEGCNIVLANRNAEQGAKVAAKADEIAKKHGGSCINIITDVAINDQVVAMVKKTIEKFGKIDILVNNAGWEAGLPFVKKDRPTIEKELAINVWGPMNCMKAVLPHMVEKKQGVVISIGSDSGRVGESGSSVYAGSKGFIVSLTKSVAKELGRSGIRLNVVSPGLTLPGNPPGTYDPKTTDELSDSSVWINAAQFFTPERIKQLTSTVYPVGRIAGPKDIADAVLFMASDRSGDITGQTLSVSGGYTMI